jgi:hypothetical protein
MALIYNTDKLDSCLNTYREVFSDPFKSGNDNAFTGDVILPLDFSLEMDGLSGIIPHSAFTIPENSLPNSYIIQDDPDKGLSKIAFILHTIDQNFNNNKWTTKITGQTLNIRFDELTDAQKKAIEDFKLPTLLNKPARKLGSDGPKGGGSSSNKGYFVVLRCTIPNMGAQIAAAANNIWSELNQKGLLVSDTKSLKQSDPKLWPSLREYYVISGLLSNSSSKYFEGAKILPAFASFVKTAWSAAFMSYIMYRATKANPGIKFPYAGAHTLYSQSIKKGGYTFQALDPSKTPLLPGDLVVKNREGNNLTFNSTYSGLSHGDVVLSVEDSNAKIIGGNLSSAHKIMNLKLKNKIIGG